MNSNQHYVDQVRNVSNVINGGSVPPPMSQQTVQATVVAKKKGFGLPAVAKLDPEFTNHYRIGRDVFLVTVLVKLAIAKVGTAAAVLLPIVSFQVVIPAGFALMIAGAATGKKRLVVWGAAVAICGSFGIWLFL